MLIHFFKERTKDRVDFHELIDLYFDKFENSTITSDESQVDITFKLSAFDFEYHYYISKRSRVSSIYRLNAAFININLYVDIPSNIPQFISRLIFKQISEICEKFDFEIYYEKFDDIKPFDMFELITILSQERNEYLSQNPEVKTYKVPMKMLNEMCRYQSSEETIKTLIKDSVNINKYIVLCNKRTGAVENCITWRIGTPCIFPPHLNYIKVEEDENLIALIPIEVFYKYTTRLMLEINDESIDFKLLYLNEKGSIKAAKLFKRMRKAVISLANFDVIKITDLTEI